MVEFFRDTPRPEPRIVTITAPGFDEEKATAGTDLLGQTFGYNRPEAQDAPRKERCAYRLADTGCGFTKHDHVLDGGRSVVCTHHFVPPRPEAQGESPCRPCEKHHGTCYCHCACESPEAQGENATCRPTPKGAGKKILIIPDTQVKPGVPTQHLTWAGLYAAQKRPDVIVHLGDHWDFPSLCSYDKGKKSYEGRRYSADLDAGIRGLDLINEPIAKVPGYNPRKVFLRGNHEHRAWKAVEEDAKLEGTMGPEDVNVPLRDRGWEVHEFLEVVDIAGIDFSHYFVGGVMGRPVASAAALLRERHKSSIMGHSQLFQIATHPKTHQMAIFAGAFYLHDEQYLTPQDRAHRRHLIVLHEAKGGVFDLMTVSTNFLRRRFS